MKRKGTFNKIGLYILSLMLLFIFIIILSAKIPVCYGSSCKFIGFYQLATTNIIPIICIILIGISFYFYRRFKALTKVNNADSVTITACQSENYESLTFLATYIVPFMGFSFDDIQKDIAYFLLIIAIGLIFIKTDKYYANPTLALFGYKLYRVNISHSGSGEVKNVIAISMDALTIGDQVFYSFFDDYVFIARKK
ncbi:anti-phage protein KwaA [Buttiauxella brennerae]|uniref:anti-phage protein KwaA n=1 Tax=Buttiauxella brennerae TaxID=82988 RepID=UPI00286EBB73|nr:anti-phage protein KwaA [Buttiauxella brennerae]